MSEKPCQHLKLTKIAPHGTEDLNRFRVRCDACKHMFEAKPFVITVWQFAPREV